MFGKDESNKELSLSKLVMIMNPEILGECNEE